MSPRLKFQTPTGMKDILPEDQPFYQKVYSVVDDFAKLYRFQRIDTPILEDLGLFEKGTGQATDIVEKQMYVLKTKGGEYLALRPEFTPSFARAYFEHGMVNLPHPIKLYTYGPLFRYERPQAGRFRQFYQFNFEIFGTKKAIIDAEIIYLFWNILKELGLKNLIIHINSIGDNQCRPYFKKVLVKYLRSKERQLCPDCKRRLRKNPLRVLDCKQTKCQEVISQAPQVLDYLCDECKKHLEKVLEYLDELEVPYFLNPYLVRGLDYYAKTVFEIVSQDEQEKNLGALAGGGRYDDLLRLIGKKDVPACGAAAGIERIVALMKQREDLKIKEKQPEIFIAQLGDKAKIQTLKILQDLRKVKIFPAFSLAKDSLGNQLKIADKLGVKFTILIGEEEVLEGKAIIRDMESGVQRSVKIENLVSEIKKLLKKKK
ncbi:histidine--tRNA ligase [bacterium]|nr:histidine--tRNA ligase [bacterium]